MIVRIAPIYSGWRLGIGAAVLLGAGFIIGDASKSTPVAAQQKTANPVETPAANAPPQGSQRVVAYIYGTTPITREEFGDYLIENYWKDHLELFVHKKIIDMECAKHGVSVTPQEIDAAILDDCKKIKISQADFVKTVLKTRYRKTLNEWRNDVMRPRLLLAKLCAQRIEISDDDLKKMFDNQFGEKAVIKIILWPMERSTEATKMYGRLRGDPNADAAAQEAAWNAVATKQPDANLAASGGAVDPIGRHSGPESAKVEEIAFNTKVGDISPIITVPNLGLLVVRRVGTVPPVKDVTFEGVKEAMRKQVLDRKVEHEIPLLMKKLQEEAKPNLLLTSVFPSDRQAENRK